MKKTLVFALVLVAASLAFANWADAYVTAQEEAVTMDEYVLFGDKSAAEGLVFNTQVELENQLFWDVDYSVSEDRITRLDYEYFDAEQQSLRAEDESHVSLNIDNIEIGAGAGGGNLSLTYSSDYVRAVAGRTADGEYHEEIITVSDYYSYFPLRFDYYNVYSRETKLYPAMEYVDYMPELNAYFRIPVPEDLKVKVGVGKSDYGTITEYHTEPANDDYSGYPSVETYTATGEKCAYFAFTITLEGLGDADYSQIKDGYGIYKIPFYSEEVAGTTHIGSDLQMVYSIDPSCQKVMSLTADQTGDKMLLVTLEGGEYYLTVLDMENAAQLQKIHLMTGEEDYNHIYLFSDDGVYLYLNSDSDFALVTVNSEGEYYVSMLGELRTLQEMTNLSWFKSNCMAIAYSEGRMALVTTVAYYGIDTAVAVFCEGEVAFAGIYDYSGMTGRSLERRDWIGLAGAVIDVGFS